MKSDNPTQIRKVCVIGAGTMGAGIAAQVANAGLEVLLLDQFSDGDQPNKIVISSLQRIMKSDPPLLMEPSNIDLIDVGNIDQDIERICECDWVVEAIVEQLDIKRELYRSLEPHLKPGTLISSNTSTIPISFLVEGMSEEFRQKFCITHFFNPVRYMRLLELVRGEETASQTTDRLSRFCEEALGKGVVECADTPGFLGNRVGVYAMQAAIHEAIQSGIKIEEADALFGRPMGIPKTGVFGLYDLIGLDLMADVVRSLRAILPEGDDFFAVGAENPLINTQIEKGYTGNKGKGGFYAVIDGENCALDLETGDWRPRNFDFTGSQIFHGGSGLRALIDGDDRLSRFCWNVIARILIYSASLLPHVTQSPQDIDDAMKLGYNWNKGPFEMLDEIGVEWFVAKLKSENRNVPAYLEQSDQGAVYRVIHNDLQVRHWCENSSAQSAYRSIALPDGVIRFHLMRQCLSPIQENESASLFHLEDGIRLVEFHTKANALDGDCMAIISKAASDPGPGIIIHNDAQHFSAGVNLEGFLSRMTANDWQGIDEFLADFQQAVRALLYCGAPVVGAPSGLAIGGGYEVLAHCDAVIAHSNSVMGLVEPLVGLIPGGGGVKETYYRWFQRTGDWEKAAWKTFSQISYGKTGSSPALSAELAYFLPQRDQEVMNRDRLIGEAQSLVHNLSRDYQPRISPDFVLAGSGVFDAMQSFLDEGVAKGKFLPHDARVGQAIACVLTGGPGENKAQASEQDLFDLERANFIRLAKTPETMARIKSMLSGNGPVRN